MHYQESRLIGKGQSNRDPRKLEKVARTKIKMKMMMEMFTT